MKLSRRNFLSAATGAAATFWSSIGLTAAGSWSERGPGCVVLDLNADCALRESLQGYQAALAGEHNHLAEASLNSQRRCRLAIVPGIGAMDPVIAGMLLDLLEAGTHVLLESGAGFLSPAELTAHQRMLQRYFDIVVHAPVDLWPGKSAHDPLIARPSGRHPSKRLDGRESVPYVDYVWPHETRVRDFSRVIPVSANAEDIIGAIGVTPVALKKCVANGTLIFLGSPLGPALRAHDSEAHAWLRSVTASTQVLQAFLA
jgi:hypothetical protein